MQLLAVSKSQPAGRLRTAFAEGLSQFGENYLQEALVKMSALRDLAIGWHHIGSVQSNKTREIAEHFDWVHGVDRMKIAERLSTQRPVSLPPLQVCVQVNLSGEASKSGCAPGEALALCRQVAALPRLRLRGLMLLPAPGAAGADIRAPFAALRRLMAEANAQGMQLDTLSMGMSDDFEAAIAEGATIVRIGTALFGERP